MPKLVTTQEAIRARLSGRADNKYDDGTPISRRPPTPTIPEAQPEPPRPDPFALFSTVAAEVIQSLSGVAGMNQEVIARLEMGMVDLKEMHRSMMMANENRTLEEWQFTWQTDRLGNRVGLRAKQIK